MNKRQIQRILRKVFEDWEASITDDKVRGMVHDHTLITGGSIASLLLGEKVNDFDVYFTDFETTKEVAKYYLKQFNTLNPGTKIKPHLSRKAMADKRVKVVVKSIGFCSEKGDAGYRYFEGCPDVEGETFVGARLGGDDEEDRATALEGGLLPGDASNADTGADDPDTYTEDEEDEDADTPGNLSSLDVEHDGTTEGVTAAIVTALDETDGSSEALEAANPVATTKKPAQKPKYRPIFMTSNAITLSNGVQLVLRFYGSPEEIHANYDFVHCTNYWTSKDKALVLNQAALESLMTRELEYRGSKYPICSIIRTRKFVRRGWKINAGQFLKMCFQISELDLKNPAVLEDQLTGVDTAYFMQLIDRIKHDTKVDPKQEINSIYIVSLIDRMF